MQKEKKVNKFARQEKVIEKGKGILGVASMLGIGILTVVKIVPKIAKPVIKGVFKI